MKRRNFLANSSLALVCLSAPIGLAALTAPSFVPDANQAGMLAAFQRTLADSPCPEELKARMTTVATVEFSDANRLRFRSLTGERFELRRAGDQVVICLLASTQ